MTKKVDCRPPRKWQQAPARILASRQVRCFRIPPILLCVVSHNLTVPSNKRVDATPHFVDSEAFCLISPLVSNEIELTRPNLSKSIENPLKSIESFENEYCDGNVERLVIAQCT